MIIATVISPMRKETLLVPMGKVALSIRPPNLRIRIFNVPICS